MESFVSSRWPLAAAGPRTFPAVPPRPCMLTPRPSFAHQLRPHPSAVRQLVCMASSNATSPDMAPAFHPTIWGDFFIKLNQPMQKSDKWMEERINELKEEVSGMFEACKDMVEQMYLVDVLQRLGIDYHFEEQIVTTLRNIHSVEFNSSSLHDVALRFRLLRQQGFWVSPDEFDKFKCEDGSFNSDITNDPKCLLSLYNAANLLTHNEGPLEEALLFARQNLELVTSSLKSPLAEQVTRALQIPLSRTLKRVETLNYISEYNTQELMFSPSILEMAKLDFNLLQKIHQNELKDITQWWADVSSDIGLHYVRDRVVECYFCAYTVYYEKEHARARLILAKLIMLTSILDDTYDVHATLEEGRKLNEALQRWDESAVSLLPKDLRKYFLSVLSNFRKFEDELDPEEKYRNAYNIKAFQTLSSYYLQEAEWFHQNYMPSFEEQVHVSTVTGGGLGLCVGLLIGMGDMVTKEACEWAIACPDASRAFGEVTRFMDDLAASKNGKDKMDVASSIECYMKEHNVTSEIALAKISCLVDDAWKTLNQSHFEDRALLPFVQRLANLTMCIALLFHDKRDGYTNSVDFKDMFKTHFVNPIPF